MHEIKLKLRFPCKSWSIKTLCTVLLLSVLAQNVQTDLMLPDQTIPYGSYSSLFSFFLL